MSQKKLYVGNLSYQTTEDDLRQFFNDCGPVETLKLIMDRETGRSKGFAFVTFETEDAAKAGIELSGTELDGRQLRISEAREDQRRSGGGDRRRW